jgi:PAS domain S-box-containing protein
VAESNGLTPMPRTFTHGLALFAGYFLLADLGLRWGTLSGAASPMFPAAGLALAGLLLGGLRLWPAIVIGRLAAGLVQGSPLPLWVDLAIAGGNGLGAVAGTYLLQRLGFQTALARLRDVLGLVAIGVLHSLIPATVGSAALVIALDLSVMSVSFSWLSWWVGNVAGVLVVTPVILTWAARTPPGLGRAEQWHLAASTIATAAAAWLVFGSPWSPMLRTFVLFPFIIWAALGSGVRGAATAMLPITAFGVWGTTLGYGPLAAADAASDPMRFILLQQFLAMAAVSGLLLAVIADERRAHQALRASETRLALALEAGQLGFWDWHVPSGRVRYGGLWAPMLGYDPGDIPPHLDAWKRLVHPDDLEEVTRTLRAHVEGQTELYECEYRLRHRDGSWRWVLDRGRVVQRDGNGAAVRALGTHADITARKQAEEAVHETEVLTRTIAENSTQGLALTDHRGYCTYANPALLSMTGYTADEIMSAPLHDLVHHHHPDGRPYPRDECPLDRALPQRSSVRRHEDLFFRKDGSSFAVSCAASPIVRAGEPVSTVIEIRDVTAERAAEAERTELLARERGARLELERASRIKDEFLSTLSHELRTPLSAIVGWSQILRHRMSDADTDLQRGLSAIDRNARIQVRLVEDLLDMSGILSGKLRLDIHSVDLGDVVTAALGSVAPVAAAKNIRLEWRPPPGRRRVRGDPNRLQQVVWNLLNNAIRFTPGDGTVRVALACHGEQIGMTVSDTGQGISAEFLPYVFDRFRQADSSTTRHHGGLGLGLAIVKHLAELHGGSVRVASAGPGQGATFTVELPAEPADTAAPPVKAGARDMTDTPLQAFEAIDLDGVSVLLVDDEPDARELLGRVFERCRAHVRLAASAEDALLLLEAEPPDVLVSDVGMPGMDGYEFIQRVRALPPERGGLVPALALTAYADPADRARALQAGFQAHLPKPVNPGDLLAAVASFNGGTARGGIGGASKPVAR